LLQKELLMNRVKSIARLLAGVIAFSLVCFPMAQDLRVSAAPASEEPVWSDEFAAKEARWAWSYKKGTGYKKLVQLEDAPAAVEIGITSASTSSSYSDCSLHESKPKHMTGILEMRLRTSDDNGITQPGQGTRGWGFWDGAADAAWFWSASPESDPQLTGFRAQVARNGVLYLNQPLAIDMRQWHVYRVELLGHGVNFYVDGVLVAVTNERPSAKQRPEFWIDNYRIILGETGFTKQFLKVAQDQKMFIDWVRFYQLTSDLALNRSFEIDQNNDSYPDGWKRTNSTTNDWLVTASLADGANVYQMSPSSSATKYKSLNQALSRSGRLTDLWQVTLWSRTELNNPAGSLRVRLAFKNSDGVTKSASQTLIESAEGGYQTVTLSAPQDYVSMTIFVESSITQGNAYFDDVLIGKP
jgi:hypothetical protein